MLHTEPRILSGAREVSSNPVQRTVRSLCAGTNREHSERVPQLFLVRAAAQSRLLAGGAIGNEGEVMGRPSWALLVLPGSAGGAEQSRGLGAALHRGRRCFQNQARPWVCCSLLGHLCPWLRGHWPLSQGFRDLCPVLLSWCCVQPVGSAGPGVSGGPHGC